MRLLFRGLFEKTYKQACKCNSHHARHTHASLMLKQGVHPKIVQERLGHASIQITLDTYSHVAPGLQESAAVGFDKMVLTRREKEAVNNHY